MSKLFQLDPAQPSQPHRGTRGSNSAPRVGTRAEVPHLSLGSSQHVDSAKAEAAFDFADFPDREPARVVGVEQRARVGREVWAPALLHQRALLELYVRLRPYVSGHALGEVLLSPADIEFSPKRLLQPDRFVIPSAAGKRGKTWRDVKSLLLAVEALSPTTARADRFKKRKIYQDEGVPEYWVIDLDARAFERWRPGEARPEVLAETLVWRPRADIETLEIDLEEYFTAVLD